MNNPVRIIALTETGLTLARKIQQMFPTATLAYKPKPFASSVQQAFQAGEALLMICATGIAVRCLAPVLNNKHSDPPVVVMDEHGRFVIPLLSGHEGGANAWAAKLAAVTQAQLVLTTAQAYTAPIYTLGVGCERGCPVSVLTTLCLSALDSAGLNLSDISSINSIDIKADETGLIQLAQSLSLPYQTFSAQSLSTMESLLSTKSEYVYKTVGVYGVAESAALYAAQQHTQQSCELVLPKIKNTKATCAIARSYHA